MGKPTVWMRIRWKIGDIAFTVFLWAIQMTQDEYFDTIRTATPVEWSEEE